MYGFLILPAADSPILVDLVTVSPQQGESSGPETGYVQGIKLFGGVEGQLSPITIGPDGQLIGQDAGPSWTSLWGINDAAVVSATSHSADVAVTAAPTAGQKLVIDDIIYSVDTAATVQFKEETSLVVKIQDYATARATRQITPRGKLKLANIGTRLLVSTSVACNIAVAVSYHSES